MDNKNIDIALQAWGNKIVAKAQKNLGNHSDTGQLRRSIQAHAFNGKLIFYFEQYGIPVDTGRHGKLKKVVSTSIFGGAARAAFPNITAIKKWINNKPIKPKSDNKMSVDQLTYVIGRSIYNTGIRATLFFTKPFELEFPALLNEITEAFALDMADYLETIQI